MDTSFTIFPQNMQMKRDTKNEFICILSVQLSAGVLGLGAGSMQPGDRSNAPLMVKSVSVCLPTFLVNQQDQV